ncbi:MAG: hypothetical protein K9N09_09325 [Candidatus Cloacimonetes bacterium]|nr:hypothetical protein [Candidatus Cloacimonadota bacterium]MCF7813900.1 hypothetical protein [Candidatus Cloacimonadota bacterium]MCF7868889.1 hypothetical protein [Candidatus Cloacimonadota bacterium]MCF7884012.1 hypothetical protein [Candidatus Cloacimonadota bacterium]
MEFRNKKVNVARSARSRMLKPEFEVHLRSQTGVLEREDCVEFWNKNVRSSSICQIENDETARSARSRMLKQEFQVYKLIYSY